MKTFAFVFARGGSKGVPRKNIRNLAGKPLFAHSIDLAKKIEAIDEIFVSTEDQTIAQIARENGADVIDRPIELARDNTPEWLAWRHAVNWLEERDDNFEVFLCLPPTSPLRNVEDVKACITCLDHNTDSVVTMTEASRSPWFNMVSESKDGFIDVLMKRNEVYTRRQDTPKIYDMTTVAYVTRPEYIKNANGVFEGRVRGVEIPTERAQDIDTELDFRIVEFLMEQTNNSEILGSHAE